MRPLQQYRVRVPVRAYLIREQYAEPPVAARPACNFQQPRVFLQHVEQDFFVEQRRARRLHVGALALCFRRFRPLLERTRRLLLPGRLRTHIMSR